MDGIDFSPPTTPSNIENVLPNNITAEERENLKQTLAPFHKVLTWTGQPIGRTSGEQHHIDIGTAPPQGQLARRIPFHDREELNTIIDFGNDLIITMPYPTAPILQIILNSSPKKKAFVKQ